MYPSSNPIIPIYEGFLKFYVNQPIVTEIILGQFHHLFGEKIFPRTSRISRSLLSWEERTNKSFWSELFRQSIFFDHVAWCKNLNLKCNFSSYNFRRLFAIMRYSSGTSEKPDDQRDWRNRRMCFNATDVRSRSMYQYPGKFSLYM